MPRKRNRFHCVPSMASLVDRSKFSSRWCGPCSRIAPKIEEWSNNDYKDKVVFIKVDVDQSDDISGKYNVEAMPTFVFLKDGKEVNRIVGADQAKLKAAIDEKK